MGERGGSSRPGCKWHPRQHGEGVCAICLRTSLEKLAAYQGEYQESLDTYTGAFLSSTSGAEFLRERDSGAQSFQPTYPSVSYRTRSKKEHNSKGGTTTSQNGSTSDSRKPKDASSSKVKTSWGVAVHRIASIRSALTSLWKSDKLPEEKRKQNTTEIRDTKQYAAANSETRQVNGELKRDSTSSGKTTPWTGSSSSFVSKFTHRSGTAPAPEDSQARWRRSKSSREVKRESQVYVPTDPGPQTPDGNHQAHDAPSPIQPVPHPSSKSSPWRFFSRSGSRRSPHRGFKVETLNS